RCRATRLVCSTQAPTRRLNVPLPAQDRPVLRGFRLPEGAVRGGGRRRAAPRKGVVRRGADALSAAERIPGASVLEPRGVGGGGGCAGGGVGGVAVGWVEACPSSAPAGHLLPAGGEKGRPPLGCSRRPSEVCAVIRRVWRLRRGRWSRPCGTGL